ncbi:MAG: hypothetical protein JST42_21950 [Bacteroidetes bacterium]|nr:hypothetical protein [Bacteroidota bacterium]
MKQLILFFLGSTPACLLAQHYEIKKDDLTATATFTKSGNKLDASTLAEAYILFPDLSADDLKKLKVTVHKKADALAPDAATPNKFPISDLLTSTSSAFDIFFDNQQKGTVSFDFTAATTASAASDDSGTPDTTIEAYVGALASANFVGNNKFLSNLTPIINLGGVVPLVKQTGSFSWDLDINPYIGADVASKDTATFLPSLMLYGRAGLSLNNYLNFDISDKLRFVFMPFGFGLKFIPNLLDSGNTIIQHNIRGGIAFRYTDVFVIGAQLTHGWHNLTSASEVNYKKAFGTAATDIDYITVIGQFSFKGKKTGASNYIFFEWRNLLSRKHYEGLPNSAILTLGLRKTLELTGGGVFAAAANKKPAGGRRRAVHYPL